VRYLLDTNILSEPTRKAPHPGVIAGLSRHQTDACTAAPVLHELTFGIRCMVPGRKREQLTDYLSRLLEVPMAVLPYDLKAAQWHALERARLEAAGLTPAFVDGQIAAIAAVNGLALVTRNVGQFQVFGGLEIENWFEPSA
jgi:tRNA(fMet)-specific endonuclease VapC